MGDTLVSFIRTYVPLAAGSFIAWLLTMGVVLEPTTEASLAVGLTGVVIAAYYALARLLERKWPFFGVLLGSVKQPTYREVGKHVA